MDNIDKTTTETGQDLIQLNGQIVNETLSKREVRESFNLMAHLANGASVRDLPRVVDKTDLNEDDKFIIAALVVTCNAFCYHIAGEPKADDILGGTEGWKLLREALDAAQPKEEAEESVGN
jgi:hypothetical protein